jgi:hypothetical protein
MRGQRSGQAMVEFALVAPIFFFLIFAIIEGGRFILYYETLNNATREGARYAIVNGSNSLVCPQGPMQTGMACDLTGERTKQRVRDSAFGLLGNVVNVAVDWPDSYNNRDMRVRVAADYRYRTLVPLIPLPEITIKAESTLVINN